jgi:hypothetical protein
MELSERRVGVLYEAGERLYGEIVFAAFGIDDVTQQP